MELLRPALEALTARDVRCVVVGGVAVVLHGHARLTADLDLAVDLAPGEARRAIEALTGLGLRPVAPVDPMGFADPETRAAWRAEKGMEVFGMHDPSNPLVLVDLFVENPIPFEELWERSSELDLEGLPIRVASIPDLIAMKRQVGRQEDLADIAALERILEERDG